MKHLLILILISITSGCGTFCKFEEHYTILVLSDDQFMVGEDVSDLSGAISYLGPESDTLIGIALCPDIKSQTTEKVITALNSSGYTKIGLATDSNDIQQELCSNYTIKGTSE